jgi:hypothetical protein
MAQRSIISGLALSLVLGACQGASSPSDGAGVTPGATGLGATAPPSSSTGPATDVAAALREQLEAVTSGEQRLSGTLRVGDIQATFDGTSRSNGPDSRFIMSTTVGGVVSTDERAKVAGARYLRRGEGPWLSDTSTDENVGVDAAVKQALASVRDLDANASGSAPHRIVSDTLAFDPVAFGFAAAGQASPGTAIFTFMATPDGTPLSVLVEASWMVRSGAGNDEASLHLTIEFVALNNAPTITAPADVWTMFSSDRFGYAYATPATFNSNGTKGYDGFVGPGATSYIVSSRTPSQGNALNVIAESELATWRQQLQAAEGTSDVVTLGGEPARLLSLSGRSPDLGGKVSVYEVVAVKGKFFYALVLVARREDASAARLMARQLMATFSFTD